MRFTSAVVLAFFALTAIITMASAAGENPITHPLGGSIKAGSDVTITWTVTFGNSCDLVLRKGKDTDLAKVLNIATGIPNTGSFTWPVPLTLVAGNDYSIQVVADNKDNYSPMFTVVTGATSTSTSAGSTSASASGVSSSTSTTHNSTRLTASASSTPNATTSAISVNGGVHLTSPFSFVLCLLAGLMYLR